MLLTALISTLPYLGYTYRLTGKVFYWGNAGGMSLYWMSTPFNNEYGDWKGPELTNMQYPIGYPSAEGDALLKANHLAELNGILKHPVIEQDALYKQLAIRNIKRSPTKFIKNYIYNCCRLLFNQPYAYTYQNTDTINYLISGSLILWASVFAGLLTLLNWRLVIFPVKFGLLITLVYLAITGVVSAYPRQLDVVLPLLFFWIAFMTSKLPKISLRFTALPADSIR